MRTVSGFTLIELLAALALSGLVVLGAARMLHQLADSGARLGLATARQDAEMNGPRLLADLVYNIETAADSGSRFSGADHDAAFTTWCTVPPGWLERCRVALRAETNGDSGIVTAQVDGGASLILWRGPGNPQFRYFSRVGSTPQWWRGWGTTISTPAAIGVVAKDTLVLPVGARL